MIAPLTGFLTWCLLALLPGARHQAQEPETPTAVEELRTPASARSSRDSIEMRARMSLRIAEFHSAWQTAWRESELARRRVPTDRPTRGKRLPFLHCHNDGRDWGAADGRIEVLRVADGALIADGYILQEIKSAHSAYAVCPSWLLATSVESADDESIAIEGAIIDDLRAPVRALRGKLLNTLDSASTQYPGDGWLSGQRVRLYLDQDEPAGAIGAATACAAELWWCKALVAFVHAKKGDLRGAETLYVAMQNAMPPALRCEWDNLEGLLQPNERKDYRSLDCSAKRALNTRLWWLADPLFRTSSNERFVEHYTRRVEIALRTAVARDERYSWVEKDGGDAIISMVERYGWPTYTAWAGYEEDTNHTTYLDAFHGPPMAPYTTFEYTIGRVRTMPPVAVTKNPFVNLDSAMQLRAENERGEPVTQWWPAEHFRPERPIVQLRASQAALFRRQSNSLVAVASAIDHPAIVRSRAGAHDVILLTTREPGKIDSLALTRVRTGATAALRGIVPSDARVIAVESHSATPDTPDARTRFGVTPPPPLDSMKRGDIAVSDPAILTPSETGTLPAPSEELLNRMMGTTVLDSAHRRIAVYWETYGVSALDTVTVYVRVASDEQLSTVRRVGIALNVASDPNREVVQRWTEPDAQRGTQTLDGPIPVQMRTIMLNLSQLEPGQYVLEVGLERKDGVTSSGRRRITITR
jgi:hypothetical protein